MRRFRSGRSVTVGAGGATLEAWVAASFRARLVGLAGLRAIPAGAALLIPRCAWVHTWCMRFAIDVAFLEWPPGPAGCAVLGVAEAIAPRRSVRLPRPALRTAVIEAGPGALLSCGIESGCYLQLHGR
jgi:uncharacterized membrane protein (UPF0127 family)